MAIELKPTVAAKRNDHRHLFAGLDPLAAANEREPPRLFQ